MSEHEEQRKVFGIRKTFYESVSDSFSTIRRSELEIVQELLTDIPKGGHVLEIGCGTGFLSHLLIRRGFIVDGIDLEFDRPAGVRKYFQEDLRDRWPSNIEPKSYDLVISLAAMHHIAPPGSGELPASFLTGLMKSLRPRGCLIMLDVGCAENATGHNGHPAVKTGIFFRKVIDQNAFPPHKGEYLDRTRTLRALADCGFHSPSQEYVKCPWLFPSENAMCTFIKTMFNLINLSDDQISEQLKNCIGVRKRLKGCVELDWGLQVFTASCTDCAKPTPKIGGHIR